MQQTVNAFLISMQAVLKLLMIVFAGVLLQKCGYMTSRLRLGIAKVIYYCLLPCLMFTSIAANISIKTITHLFVLPLYGALTPLLGILVGKCLVRLMPTTKEFGWRQGLSCIGLGNSGYLPLVFVPAVLVMNPFNLQPEAGEAKSEMIVRIAQSGMSYVSTFHIAFMPVLWFFGRRYLINPYRQKVNQDKIIDGMAAPSDKISSKEQRILEWVNQDPRHNIRMLRTSSKSIDDDAAGEIQERKVETEQKRTISFNLPEDNFRLTSQRHEEEVQSKESSITGRGAPKQTSPSENPKDLELRVRNSSFSPPLDQRTSPELEHQLSGQCSLDSTASSMFAFPRTIRKRLIKSSYLEEEVRTYFPTITTIRASPIPFQRQGSDLLARGISSSRKKSRKLWRFWTGHITELTCIGSAAFGLIPPLQGLFFSQSGEEYGYLEPTITNAMRTLANAVSPIVTILLGANILAAQRKGTEGRATIIPRKTIITCLFGKLILLPIIGTVLVYFSKKAGIMNGDDPILMFVILTQFCAPSAQNLTLMCELANYGQKEISIILFYMHVVAIISMTAWTTFYIYFINDVLCSC